MPKDTVSPECRTRIIQDHTLLHDAQLAFLEEVEKCGGSIIATSHRFQMKSSELARRACLLDLMSFWQAADYDAERKSSRNLPSFIALEDCLVALRERHGTFDHQQDFLTLQDGIYKLKRDEIWTKETLQTFLCAGERIFATCRDSAGVTSVFAPCGLDALDRTSSRILKDNPKLRADLNQEGDALIERYFDHLSEDDIQQGCFDIISIARGENLSPAWIAGKLLVAGLVHGASPTLDPVLDPTSRALTMAHMDNSPLSITNAFADKLEMLLRSGSGLPEKRRHAVRLRLAAAQAGLRQMCEITATRACIVNSLDHLDRALQEAGSAGESLGMYSFAAHTRLKSL